MTALNETVITTRGADISQAIASGQLITGEPPFGYHSRSYFDHNDRVIQTETENRANVSTTAGVGDWIDRTFAYDMLDNLVEATQEIDANTTITSQFSYDPNELRTELIKPAGNVVKTTYDERNLIFQVFDGYGSADESMTQYDYDLNSNLAQSIDAEDNDGDGSPEVTMYIRDGFNRRVMVIDALGNQHLSNYDVASNRVQAQVFEHRAGQPAAGNVQLSNVHYRYDELNRLYQTDAALFLADGFSPLRPVDLRDGNSDGFVTTQIVHDALSRPILLVEDDQQVMQTVYDGASRPIETIDALGNRQVMSYDNNDNLVQDVSIELSGRHRTGRDIHKL